MKEHMDALFDEDRANALRSRLTGLSPQLREAAILEELTSKIKTVGGRFVLPFTFRNSSGTRTSHKLIFVSKHFKGYEIMKDIMAKESSTLDEGVPSFMYSPADRSMPLLFSLTQPFSSLRHGMIKAFSGRQLSLDDIYKEHSVGTPYVERNYRDVVLALEEEGGVSVELTKGKRRPGTYPAHVLIKFPEGGSCGE